MSSSPSSVKEIEPTNNIRSISFGVALPQSIMDDDPLVGVPRPSAPSHLMGDAGIVGTLTFLPNAAMVWLGWGSVDTRPSSSSSTTEGTGFPVHMGPMLVAFPRTSYQGLSGEGSCSQLIGSDNGDDSVLSHQMASRLSQKVQQPVFCSCALFSGTAPEWMAGLDQAAVTQRAAALAERSVRKLLVKEVAATK